MRKPEEGKPHPENQWGFIRFCLWAWSKFKEVKDWFRTTKMEYKDDEAGALMKRHMDHKIGYDHITSWWCDQSFWKKSSYIIGSSLSAGLLGLFVGAPTLLALSVAFFSITCHTLCVSHDESRRERSRELVEETIALHEELRASQIVFDEASHVLDDASKGVEQVRDELREQSSLVEAETQRVHQATDVLVTIADEVKDVTCLLVTQEREAVAHFESIAVDLVATRQVIQETTVQIEGIGASAQQFSESVQEARESIRGFTAAANRFSLFVDETILAKPPIRNTDFSEIDLLIDRVRKKNIADNESILKAEQLLDRIYV